MAHPSDLSIAVWALALLLRPRRRRCVPYIEQRFGHWTAIEQAGVVNTNRFWRCVCDCGREKDVDVRRLFEGTSTGCGCRQRRSWTAPPGVQGRTRWTETSAHAAWRTARTRCTRPSNKDFPNDGGRGVTVCPEWIASFDAFLTHIGPKPRPAHSLDRFPDNDGLYAPGNVRWATKSQQRLNRRPRSRWLKAAS